MPSKNALFFNHFFSWGLFLVFLCTPWKLEYCSSRELLWLLNCNHMKYVAILHMANTWLRSYAHLILTCIFVCCGGNVKFYGQEQGTWNVSSFCKKTRQYFVVSLPRCFKMPIPFIPQHTDTHTHMEESEKLHKSLKQTDKISVILITCNNYSRFVS